MINFTIDEQTILRQLEPADASELFKVVDSNRAHLREWLPWLDRNTEEIHSDEFIQSTILQSSQKQGFVCGIFLENDLVGTCGYHPIYEPKTEGTIGYWLAKSAIGRGLATRATVILIEHAFKNMGITKIYIPVATGNHRSRAVCERLELQNEGIEENAEYLYDKFVDHILYFTTRDSWQFECT